MAILGLAVGARKVRAAIIDEKYTVTAFGGTDVECKSFSLCSVFSHRVSAI